MTTLRNYRSKIERLIQPKGCLRELELTESLRSLGPGRWEESTKGSTNNSNALLPSRLSVSHWPKIKRISNGSSVKRKFSQVFLIRTSPWSTISVVWKVYRIFAWSILQVVRLKVY